MLTPSLRRRLKKPLGVLYHPGDLSSRAFMDTLRSAPLVITVGDRVTQTMHELGRDPDLQVVDEVERRLPREAPSAPYSRLLRAANPAGTVTAEAARAIGSALKGEKPARILIEGEEDLLVIPAVDAAPLGSAIYYGQPGVGVVLVRVDERAKSSVKRILSSMEEEKQC